MPVSPLHFPSWPLPVSREEWLDAIILETDDVEYKLPGSSRSSRNVEIISVQKDLIPVEPLLNGPRHWGVISLAGYWIAEAFCISQYQVASSSLELGLSPGTTIGAILLGDVLVSLACAANGWVGCTFGINFPVFARASFGIRGTSVAIICRAVAAIVWFGTQTYQGGLCVQVMLEAIWPSFKSLPNHLPSSAQVTSAELLCFFIFYMIQLPLLWIHISKLRYLFMIKVIVMPIFGFTLFGWAIGRAHGFGPLFDRPTSVKGSPVAVVFFSAMSSVIAPKATLALNIADFTRYAKSPRTVVWTTILSLTIPVTLCAILGVVVTSAVEVIYGVSTWNPLQVCELWNNRAAAFFAAFCWALAGLVTNISANSTAVGNDLAMLFPKVINIRRGQFICAVLGIAACPWIVQNSATSFTSFLDGYSIFLGPVAGILLADFYILRRRKLELGALFCHGASPYWYAHGFNFRALVAFFLALVPNLPGFANKVTPSLHVPKGASYLFSVVWPVGVVVAGSLYLLLNILFPVKVPTPAQSSEKSFAAAAVDERTKSAPVTMTPVV